MQRDDIIRSISRALEAEQPVAGLFLSGSLGRGMADRFSDIDLLAVAPPAAHATIAAAYRASLAGLLPIVFWRERVAESVLVNAIAEDWQRIDFLLIAPARLPAYARDAVRPLFDRQGLMATMPRASPAPRPGPARAFLPLARTLATQLDLPWPDAFEAATWRYLERELGVARPP
jgi:predicted nucleotidyltransferase